METDTQFRPVAGSQTANGGPTRARVRPIEALNRKTRMRRPQQEHPHLSVSGGSPYGQKRRARAWAREVSLKVRCLFSAANCYLRSGGTGFLAAANGLISAAALVRLSLVVEEANNPTHSRPKSGKRFVGAQPLLEARNTVALDQSSKSEVRGATEGIVIP